ncbi:MAG TPA: hypothetical protein VFQ53_18035 [Kofleriaceae bacterium]|nr:hypothetical protein [Kofleriaceae bacterium]
MLRVICETSRQLAALPLVVAVYAAPRCNIVATPPALDPIVTAGSAGSATEPAVPEPPAKPYEPKTVEVPTVREPIAAPPARPAVPRILLPEEAIVRAMDAGRAAFVRCFKKAIDADPTIVSYKVKLHVELDPDGKITATSTDAEDPDLSRCLARAAYRLPLPPPGKLGVVDLPLFYRPDS